MSWNEAEERQCLLRKETHDFHKSLCVFRASYPEHELQLVKIPSWFQREAAKVKARRKKRCQLWDNLVAQIIEHVSHKSFSVYFSKPINSNFISDKSSRVSCSKCLTWQRFSYMKECSWPNYLHITLYFVMSQCCRKYLKI